MLRLPHNLASAPRRSELAAALAACKSAFVSIAVFSGMSDLLMLTGSFFMLETYDRVLPSRSVPTLLGLCFLAATLFVAMGVLDLIRGRILVRIGASLDESLSTRVYETIVQLPLKAGNRSDGLQPLRDLDNIRAFLSGMGPIAFCDLPWLPLYLAVVFLFHPLLGWLAVMGAAAIVALMVAADRLAARPTASGRSRTAATSSSAATPPMSRAAPRSSRASRARSTTATATACS